MLLIICRSEQQVLSEQQRAIFLVRFPRYIEDKISYLMASTLINYCLINDYWNFVVTNFTEKYKLYKYIMRVWVNDRK